MQMIIPGEPVRYGLRLAVYAPNGPRLGVLPHPLGFEAGFPLNDISSLRLTYSAHALGADLLAQPCEIAVEYSTGGAWVEPADGRFIRIKRGTDHTDRTGVSSFDCPGYSWQLRKVVLYPHPSMVDGKRPFNNVSAGAILQTFFVEGQARGAMSELAVDFDDKKDSNRKPWDKALTLALEPGVPMLNLLLNLSEQGVIDWRMRGRTLQVFNADTVMARNLAAGSAPVDLRLGRDLTEAPDDATLEDAASSILIVGEAGLNTEVTNPSALVPWGRWETFQAQGGVSDTGTMTLLGQAALERASGERVQLTRGILPHLARWSPFADYKPGDYVMAPGDGVAMSSLRIRQITLSCDKDGQIAGNLILNDRFLERDIRLVRQAAGILAGGVSSGGSGTDPAPESGGRTPAAPTGLIVQPVAYTGPGGVALGQVTVTWGAVTADVNGVAISVDGYELFMRRNDVGEPWSQILGTAGGDTSATYSPLEVNRDYAFKVRATADGAKGVFSSVVAVVVPDDDRPPPVPSAPVLSSRLGVIHVGWDGLGAGGVPMPADFSRVLVWVADPLSTDPAENLDYLDAAGSAIVMDQPYGADREIWLTSIDRSGNESGPSTSSTIAAQPLVDADIIGEIISGANIVDGTLNAADKVIANTITGGLIQALAIQAGHVSANAISADNLQAGSITAAKLAAVLTVSTRIVAGNSGGARVEINSTGIHGFNAAGTELVSLLNSGSFTLRSASAGARIELDVTGLRAFNSSGTKTFGLAATNGEVDILGRISSGLSGKRLVINPLFGADPEIRFYEDNSEYHYITSYVASPNTLQIGSAVSGDRKGLIQLTPTEIQIGIVNGTGGVLRQGLRISDNGSLSFLGRFGNPGGGAAFTRGNVSFPANTLGSVGYGFTFTDGDAFVIATMFNIYGPHGVTINSRNNGGFGFSTTEGTPGAGYDIQYFTWKQ
ncbi:hypothetical protein [Streptosporangium canum]|uniref:hypothetical protein n=1 Tax=Streptosporangium canum TaxID=324952 RepID=UPI00378C2C65